MTDTTQEKYEFLDAHGDMVAGQEVRIQSQGRDGRRRWVIERFVKSIASGAIWAEVRALDNNRSVRTRSIMPEKLITSEPKQSGGGRTVKVHALGPDSPGLSYRNRREALSVTRGEVAELSGLTYGDVGDIETKREPTPEEANALETALIKYETGQVKRTTRKERKLLKDGAANPAA